MYRSSSGNAPNVNSWLDVQSAVRGLTQDFATAFNTGNYDQAAALFTSDGFLMPPQREAVQRQKPIELMLRKLGEAGHQNLRLETIRVEESGDMAVETGRYTVAVQQENGTTVADRGKFVQVWRRLESG
jgi:uncharacterized protein (TIGR02246 family)